MLKDGDSENEHRAAHIRNTKKNKWMMQQKEKTTSMLATRMLDMDRKRHHGKSALQCTNIQFKRI
jgi:hypothetical protein